MKIKVKLNDNKTYEHNVNLQHDENDNYYEMNCLNSNNEKMGYVTFKVDSTGFCSRKIWIYKIKTKEQFAHSGVGTALIYALEYFACKNNISYIEGKYYPENNAAVKFYEKYGYIIDREDYEQYINKYIDKTKVQEKLEKCIVKQSDELCK